MLLNCNDLEDLTDMLACMVIWAPDFPDDIHLTLNEAFEFIYQGVEVLKVQYEKNPKAIALLEEVYQLFDKSKQEYFTEEIDGGRFTLQDAEELLSELKKMKKNG